MKRKPGSATGEPETSSLNAGGTIPAGGNGATGCAAGEGCGTAGEAGAACGADGEAVAGCCEDGEAGTGCRAGGEAGAGIGDGSAGAAGAGGGDCAIDGAGTGCALGAEDGGGAAGAGSACPLLEMPIAAADTALARKTAAKKSAMHPQVSIRRITFDLAGSSQAWTLPLYAANGERRALAVRVELATMTSRSGPVFP